MTNRPPPIDDALSSVIDKAKTLPEFTEEEIVALHAVAEAWRGLEAFGRIATFIKTVAQYVGWAIAVYVAFRAGVLDFIKGALNR